MPVFRTNVPRNDIHKDIYTIEDFKRFMPSMRKFMETPDGIGLFDAFMPIAYEHCQRFLWGSSWAYGMSLLVAHYLTLASQDQGGEMGEASTLGEIAGLGEPTGILSGQSVGEISLNYDVSKTMYDIDKDPDAAFFNSTKYGIRYYALWKSKNPFVIGVVI